MPIYDLLFLLSIYYFGMKKHSGIKKVPSILTVFLLTFTIFLTNCQDACMLRSGARCLQCRPGYQLLSGECIVNSSTSNDNSPILVFRDIPEV